MPRDGSGTYTLPAGNPVVTSTVITPSWANPTLSDIAAALTDSLSTALLGANGIAVRTSSTTWAPRSIAVSGGGISVSNGDGASGNPTLSLDADLVAVAAFAGTGIAVRTAADTWAQRVVIGPSEGIGVTNGDGVSGNITLSLTNDLNALESLASTGFAARTAANTWAQRTISSGSNITVTNGNGVSGNPSVALNSSISTAGPITLTATNANIELGAGSSNTPFIDFHSGSTSVDYDSRILASGGNGSSGNGTLDLYAASLRRNGVYTIFDSSNVPDLWAIELLNSTGIAVRTTTNTWAQRTITAGSNITVTNGNGVSGNPTIAVADSPVFAGSALTINGSTAHIELGNASSTHVYMDFRFNNSDYSARLEVLSAAGAGVGQGNFNIAANSLTHNSSTVVTQSNLETLINTYIASASASNGYVELPDGFYLQWGSVSAAANSNTTYSLPTTFPSAHYQAVCQGTAQTATGGNDQYQFGASPASTTTVGICNWENVAVTVRFFCIGR